MAGVGLHSTLSPVHLHSTRVCDMHDGPRDHAQEIGPYCYLHLWGR